MGKKKIKKTPIGKRLKEARLQEGLSQKALGIKAGIDQFAASARMNQYETGKHMPDFGTLTRIARVLNVPASYFYCEDNELAQLVLRWPRISKRKRKQLLKAIEV